MTQPRVAAALGALLMGMAMLGTAHAATVTRTSAFEYDPATGLLTKEIVEPDNAQLRVENAYTYDGYGNRTAATVSSPATGMAAIAARSTSITYDSRGQFPVSATNAVGHSESKVFDPKFGAMTSLTGPNGLTTQWQYDSFGRKTREIHADRTQTKWDYLYCSGVNGGSTPCPALAKYLVQMTPLATDGATPNGPWSKTYFDALNREIQSETVGFDGSSVITKRTEYDGLGRLYRVSQPYYSGQTVQWTSFTYDALGRALTTTVPDNTQIIVAYNGLTVSTTNALKQTRTVVTNSQGQAVKVTDAANNSITYQYDPLGNLTKTTDPKGNVITLAYDLRGRKTQMVDPDMGSWTYDHDVLGKLVKQTDAKGQVTTIAYDKLGRMTRRAEPDQVSTWTYDSCTKGIGKICKATADNGYSSTASYDSLGRPSSNSTTIDTIYNTAVTFDGNARVATQTYPTGLAVKYVYTTLGYLKEVRNNATDALYWRADTMDAQGHLLQQTFGNNVVTQQVYDSATGRLKNIYAGAGNSVQNLSFGYDNIGNLLSRNDANQNLSETFLYDSLNRLTSATVNSGGAGVVTTSYAYDSIGNISSRSDLGTYTYGVVNSRPHALAEVALAAGGKRQFTYDANGNLTSEVQRDASNVVIPGKGRTEVYTSFNMPQALGAPGISLAFAYGPEHQRVKQIAPNATTIYLHPDNAGSLLYEKDLKADGTTEHRHFITAANQALAIVKQTGATTKVNYLHQDYLGSTTAVTDETGAVLERFAYEPFGKRRFPAGSADPNNTIAGATTDRGFTSHEHLDELGLVHMNGRIYDPALGRFMSADPTVPQPFDLQSFNRYSYARNNPLAYVDPTGFDECGYFEDACGYGGYDPFSGDPWGPNSGGYTGTVPDGATEVYQGANGGWNAWTPDPNGGPGGTVTGLKDAPTYTLDFGLGGWGSSYQTFLDSYSGNLGVMDPPSAARDLGQTAHTVRDMGVALMPGSGLPDAGAAFGRGEYLTGIGILSMEILPFLKAGKEVKVIEAAVGDSLNVAKAGDNLVYRSINPATGEVNYVGITNSLDRRAVEHLRGKGITIDAIEGLGGLSRADAKAVEQVLIEFYKLEKNGGTLSNKINSIAPSNPIYRDSLERGRELLKQTGYPGF